VALCLLALTRRPGLGAGLLTLTLLSEYAWLAVDTYSHTGTGQLKYWWLWQLKVLTGATVLSALIYGLLTGRRRLWRSAYWLLIGSLVLWPLLDLLDYNFPSWPSYIALHLCDAFSYLLYRHGAVGEWLQKRFVAAFPAGRTVLGYLAGAIPFLWSLLLSGGLFAGLYWMLGQRWKKPESGAAGPVPG
jgi:hypothetical protein